MSTKWLIIRNGALGDTILLSPLLQQIKQSFPNCYIEILGHRERAELLIDSDQADAVCDYESLPIYSLFSEEGIKKELSTYFSQFTHIIYFSAKNTSEIAERLRITQSQWVKVFPVLPEDHNTHITRHYLSSINEIVDEKTFYNPKIKADEEAILNAEYDLYRIGIRKPNFQIMGLHVGAGSPKKCAPYHYFYEKIYSYSKSKPTHLLITQGPADGEYVRQFISELNEEISYSILMEMPLKKLAAILYLCDFFVGNDSGVTHLVSALNIPTTVFFVESNPQVWCPLNKTEVVLATKK